MVTKNRIEDVWPGAFDLDACKIPDSVPPKPVRPIRSKSVQPRVQSVSVHSIELTGGESGKHGKQ